jgi:hypothetical protein
MKNSLLIFLLFLTVVGNTQKERKPIETSFTKKGRMYFSWGYNRSTYALSTINFTGPGYDFTLKNVKAADRPSPFDPSVYFSITKLSIPQFNVRVGCFLTENWVITAGYDHMKYVLDNTQIAKIYGSIDSSASAEHAGTYNGELKEINKEFVKFEHTDGLNYASIDLEYHNNLWQTNNQKFTLDFMFGAGAGFLIPKTNALLFNKRGTDAFHLAGGGISANMGTRFYFFKHFYLQATGKTGYLFMPNIATNTLAEDKASQTIHFFEFYGQFGVLFNVSKKR